MIIIKLPGKIFGISKVIFTIKLHTYTYIHTIFRHALGCFYLPSQRVNLFCSNCPLDVQYNISECEQAQTRRPD